MLGPPPAGDAAEAEAQPRGGATSARESEGLAGEGLQPQPQTQD